MKLKIISDGTPIGTRVFAEDGETVEDVERITWGVSVKDKTAKARITLRNVAVDVIGEKHGD